MLETMRPGQTRRYTLELSEREQQLINLAAEGHTDASIAHELGISESTVSTYWGRVRIKVGPLSRPEIIATIIRQEAQVAIADLQERNKQLVAELQSRTGKEWDDPEANYYRKLLDHAPDAILTVDSGGRIELVNDELCALFGYERNELEGQMLYTLIPERYRMIHLQHHEVYMDNPQKRKMAEHTVSVALHKTGREFQITASLAPVDTGAGVRVICIVHEVARTPFRT